MSIDRAPTRSLKLTESASRLVCPILNSIVLEPHALTQVFGYTSGAMCVAPNTCMNECAFGCIKMGIVIELFFRIPHLFTGQRQLFRQLGQH